MFWTANKSYLILSYLKENLTKTTHLTLDDIIEIFLILYGHILIPESYWAEAIT